MSAWAWVVIIFAYLFVGFGGAAIGRVVTHDPKYDWVIIVCWPFVFIVLILCLVFLPVSMLVSNLLDKIENKFDD
jgi:hypothetical protein